MKAQEADGRAKERNEGRCDWSLAWRLPPEAEFKVSFLQPLGEALLLPGGPRDESNLWQSFTHGSSPTATEKR